MPNRTLLLIDGQRVVNGTIYGGAETSNIPASLVQRVDVVTGGASAIWGSDAVAGVVNYVLNHNFNGLRIEAQASNNVQNGTPDVPREITFGTGFADDRGHIEGSVGRWSSAGCRTTAISSRLCLPAVGEQPDLSPVAAAVRRIPSPVFPAAPDSPRWSMPNNVGISRFATPGGLITGCNDAGALPPQRAAP